MKQGLSPRHVGVPSESLACYRNDKSHESVLYLHRVLRGVGTGLAILWTASTLSASVTLTYTGNPFNLFVGPGFGLAQSNFVRAQITFSSALPPNLNRSACIVDPNLASLVQKWSITDGVHTAQFGPDSISNLTFATDGSGAITSWCFGGVSASGFQISTVSGSGFQGPFGDFTNGYDEASECCNDAAFAWNEQGSWAGEGCNLDSDSVQPRAVYNNHALLATFTPKIGGNSISLDEAKSACGFAGFDWQQIVDRNVPPGVITASGSMIQAPPALPFYDPPSGGYRYQVKDSAVWNHIQPHWMNAFPFVYSPLDINSSGCANPAEDSPTAPCDILINPDANTINFFDSPSSLCLPGGFYYGNTNECGLVNPLAFFTFTTQLVGLVPCDITSTFCSASGFMPSAPLLQWTWNSNYSGDHCAIPNCGGVFDISEVEETASALPPDPSSGTGGITITSINGVPQTPPAVNCAATPNTLWPPNGKAVTVTVSGTITQGTEPIASGVAAYGVIDEYGQVQPSGSITLGAGGSYSFGVSLIAARNGDDQGGRMYTVVVGARDAIGNLGSCSAVVTVPHDQGQ